MPSDRPGLIMRRRLLELLQAHGEAEVTNAHCLGGAARLTPDPPPPGSARGKRIMANRRNLLIVGASGAAATRVTELALADPGLAVTGLSRRVPEGAGDWIAADLTDAAGLRRALATRPDISHSSMPPAPPSARAASRTCRAT